MEKSKNKKFIKDLRKLLFDKSNFWLPSSLAYYFVLALIPTIFIVQILFTYFKLPNNFILQYIQLLLPEISQEAFVSFIEQSSSFTIFTFIIIFFLSYNVISNGILSFLRMTNRLYKFSSDSKLVKRLKSYLITIYLLILILLFSFLLILIDNFFLNYLKINIYFYFSDFLTLIALFCIVLFFYYITPIKKLKIVEILPGTLFSSILIILILKVFNLLTKTIINFSNIYGPLEFIVSLLVLCYFISFTIFIGLGINVIKYQNKYPENSTNNQICHSS